MTDAGDLDRRWFLIATGALGAAGLFGATAEAADGGDAAGGVFIADESFAIADKVAAIEGVRLVRVSPGDDPVRVWRGRVEPLLTEGALVMGATRWSDYLIYRDLARESGRKLGFEIGPTSRYATMPPRGPETRARPERETGDVPVDIDAGEISGPDAPAYAPSLLTAWRFV